MARSSMSREQVLTIMANQASRSERLATADDVILNNGHADALGPEVQRLHKLYKRLAGEKKTK